GGGGGGAAVDLTPIQNELQTFRNDVNTRFNEARTLNTDTNTRVVDIQNNVQQLVVYAQQMLQYFQWWSQYFTNEVGPQLEGIRTEVGQIGNVQGRHTQYLQDLGTRLQTLVVAITEMQASLEVRIEELSSRVRDITVNLGNLIGTVGIIGREVAGISFSLAGVEVSINELPAALRTGLTAEFTGVRDEIAGVQREVTALTAAVGASIGAINQIPDNVRTRLQADLRRIEAAIAAIQPGQQVDYAQIEGIVQAAQAAITSDVAAALRRAQTALVTNARNNIYGTGRNSMFTRLRTMIEEVIQRIGQIQPGRGGVRQIAEAGRDISGIGNLIARDVSIAISRDIGEGAGNVPTLIEGLQGSAAQQTQALAAMQAELRRLAGLVEALAQRAGVVRTQRGNQLTGVRSALRRLGVSEQYNMRIGSDFQTFQNAITAKNIRSARSALRQVALWERRSAYRTNLNSVIGELEKLGTVINQSEVVVIKREFAVFGAKEIADLSGIQGDFAARLDRVGQIMGKNMPQRQKDTQLNIVWTAMGTRATKLMSMINGMIAAERNLLALVEATEQRLANT
ncbi:MAG TPA: hypothetical protein VJH88_04320, partial [Candidatus Nanoarchaeia archaeon]|nr:hypothetical protein [Candidatus Nanoarchaeia archaeon]